MKLIFSILVLVFSLTTMAQKYDSWEIFHNRREVASFNLKKETEDEKKVLLLNRALEEPGFLSLPRPLQLNMLTGHGILLFAIQQVKNLENLITSEAS